MDTLMNWRPMEDFMTLREALNNLFEDTMVRPRRAATATGEAVLPVDMYETPEAVIVKARVPGASADEIEITAADDTLTIRGKLSSEAEKEEAAKWNWLYHELWHGKFSRVLPLHAQVDTGKIEASFNNGELTITIPKAEKVKPKQIKIKANE